LHGRLRTAERQEVVERIEAALSAMNELFSALLDISKLDSGGTAPTITDFSIARLLVHAETTFAEEARRKGLSFRVVPSTAWVRSDFVLLERIVFNLMANAVRYTSRGGLVIGCRRRRGNLRIEVWDTGIGIPADQHEKIFGEFYRLSEPNHDRRAGLGLGLAIVDRLCRLLHHTVEVSSTPGRGSRFSATVPMAPPGTKVAVATAPVIDQRDKSKGKLVLVIDDDPFVLEGMDGILRSWGCRVITAENDAKALNLLTGENKSPDLIISDYYLSDGTTGIETVERLRAALCVPIPAFLVSGDINVGPLDEARARGFHLLHKPVDPMALRAMFHQALKRKTGRAASAVQT
jgi:CheY-like chemotaxis protein